MDDEVPCSLCGDWVATKKAFVLDEDLLHKDIVRRFICGTLKEKFICSGCRSKCNTCQGNIIYHQKREHSGMCLQCAPPSIKKPLAKKKR
jgi:hypothetical protein